MAKILHITSAYYPATYWGGPIFSVYHLNNALATSFDHEITVLTTDSAGPSLVNRLSVNLGRPVRYPAGYDVFFFRRIFGADISPGLLLKLVSVVKCSDVMHITGTYSYLTLFALITALVFNKPVVWSPRGALQASYEWPSAKSIPLKRCAEYIFNKIVGRLHCVLHVTSQVEQSTSLKLIKSAKASIIQNGVEIYGGPNKVKWFENDKLNLIYMGRLDPKKGIENLLEALALLNDRSIFLRIYGTGNISYLDSLKNLTSSLGLDFQVEFCGHVDGDEKLNAFRCSDLCIVPSHSENFCIVVAEALAIGIPVIASTGTPWKRLEEIGCGLWVSNLPTSLKAAILEIRQGDLELMGKRGSSWMSEEFSWHGVAKK
jgi:glycosyltransferase involved in cell wall biosynthesis